MKRIYIYLICLILFSPFVIGSRTLNTALIEDTHTSATFTSTVKDQGIFAEIHLHDGSTAQSIPTGVGYEKIDGFVDNGESANCTPDAANDKITITVAGKYFVSGSVSWMSGTNNTIFYVAPFLNAVEQDKIHFNRKVSVAGDVGSASFNGIIDVTTVPWDLDVRVRHGDGGSVNFTPAYMNLTVFYLGET
jgi:hypothetical protein